tara:strand:- start:30 stop:179 length:150 start_codon:yes stop_codon:yes gene_type:complete
MGEIYKEHKIQGPNEWGYFTAYNVNDCDAFTLFDKSEEGLKTQIDEFNK